MFSRAEARKRFGAGELADEDGGPLLAPMRVERHRLVFALATTIAALPILVLDNISATAESSTPTKVVAIAPTGQAQVPDTAPVIVDLTPTTAAPTTTTAAPVTTTTKAPVAPKPLLKPKPTTTTTRPPAPTTTTTAAPKPANFQDGQASWYDHQAGGCAHRTLPMGTTVRVTNLANGKVATCVVNDRGPFNSRIIDLDRTVFSQLASTNAGVIDVRIEW